MRALTRTPSTQTVHGARWLVRASAAAALAVTCAAAADARDDERTVRLVENVRANERLYENLELELEYKFKWVGPPDNPFFVNKELGLIIDEQARSRWVRQDGKLYRRLDMTRATTASKYKMDYVRGYDGDKTRIVDRSEGEDEDEEERVTAHVHHGRPQPQRGGNVLTPHTLLMFREAEGLIGFSTLLTGNPFPTTRNIQIVYEGKEELEGLHCIRVRCDCWFNDAQVEPDRLQFWIATERNYIPVREEVYGAGGSEMIPLYASTVGDFRELAPGIWLPFRQSYVKYDPGPAAQGRTVVLSRHELTIKKADLNPDHDLSLFRDISIPPGATVHEWVDGQVVRTYKQPD